MGSNLSVPTSPVPRVIVDSFCEDLFLTEGFKSPGGFLDQVQSDLKMENLLVGSRIGIDGLQANEHRHPDGP